MKSYFNLNFFLLISAFFICLLSSEVVGQDEAADEASKPAKGGAVTVAPEENDGNSTMGQGNNDENEGLPYMLGVDCEMTEECFSAHYRTPCPPDHRITAKNRIGCEKGKVRYLCCPKQKPRSFRECYKSLCKDRFTPDRNRCPMGDNFGIDKSDCASDMVKFRCCYYKVIG